MSEKSQAVAPGVYGIVGSAVNVYVLDDAESGVTIIDTGMPGTIQRIWDLLQDIGRQPDDVEHILITHADLDHVGSLSRLVKATGAPVYASAEAAQYIQKRRSPPHLKMPSKMFAGIINFLVQRAVPVDYMVTDDQVLDIAGGIRVIATPGHTPDHVSFFWERERVLFVGDLIRNVDGLSLTPPRITWNMNEARASVEKVRALDPAVMCFGHGEVWSAERDPDGIKDL
jgi:glyoxylase-like metal-dependent hydrolase (beta-lactamase superfamily II)